MRLVLVLYCVSCYCTRYVSGVTTESSENATVRETDTVKEVNVMKDNYHELLKRVINNENEIEDLKSREEHLKHELENVKKYMTCQMEELNDITIDNHDKLNDTKTALIKTRISFTQSLKLLNETMQELSHRQPEKLKCEENQTECNCTEKSEEPNQRPIDCKDVKLRKGNGVYKIYPDPFEPGFDVYCDFETDNGGWTVFQRRLNGQTDFYRGWEAYKNGFGNMEAEFWLGNQRIHTLTAAGRSELRVDMSDFDGNRAYAKYSTFAVGDAVTNYKLTVAGYSGNAGDSLEYHNGQAFTTKDRDNDPWTHISYNKNCGIYCQGAWWYKSCSNSNLNGIYTGGKRAADRLCNARIRAALHNTSTSTVVSFFSEALHNPLNTYCGFIVFCYLPFLMNS
ncbi:fibrinogen-like protein A [Mytilus edulis]|uniref:fibrinogen-like protein A n=1 Tax=Mytilus edulis TaxID=6550 RepID=UPI0039F0C98C